MPLFTNKTAPIVRASLDKDTELDFRPNITTLDEVRLTVAENLGRMANEIKIINLNTGKLCEDGNEFMRTAEYKIWNISGKEHNEEFWFEGFCIHAINLDYQGLKRSFELFLKETLPSNFAREKLINWCCKNNYHRALEKVLIAIEHIERDEKKRKGG